MNSKTPSAEDIKKAHAERRAKWQAEMDAEDAFAEEIQAEAAEKYGW